MPNDDTSSTPDSQEIVASDEFRDLFPLDENGFNWLDIVPVGYEPPILIYQKLNIPDRPKILLPEHYAPFQYAVSGSFDPKHSSIKTWADIEKHLKEEEQKQDDNNDPKMPRWFGKTKPSIFVLDMGNVTETTRRQFNEQMRRITEGVIGIIAPAGILALSVILDAVLKCLDLFALPLGRSAAPNDEQEEWRWCRAVATLAGFGKEAFRVIAFELAEKTNHGLWREYAHYTDEQLDKLFYKSWLESGYSLTTIWLDFVWFQRLLKGESARRKLDQIPLIFPLLLTLHIFKHARLRSMSDGKYYIDVAYKGRHQRIYISNEALHQSLGDKINEKVALALDTVLRIDRGVGVKKRTSFQDADRASLKDITPAMLMQGIDLSIRPEILVASAVKFTRAHEDEQFRWINPGIAISEIAVVDLNTGKVDKNATVTGEDVVTYKWPNGKPTDALFTTWRSEVPDAVLPALPGTVILLLIKNLKTFGMAPVLSALLSAVIFARLFRDELIGSPLGEALCKERPIVAMLADDLSDMDKTTNIGKTTLAVLIGSVNTPNIKVMSGATITGAPSQREYAQPIRDDGTVIWDEWKIPPANKGYFGDQASLQTLTCGGLVAVGKAGENGTGVQLDQALYTTGKYLKTVKDVYTRALLIFFMVHTDLTRNTDAQLVAITSGRASKIIRIAALLYAKKYNLVEELRALKPVGSDVWRFWGHATIASYLLGGETEGIKAYLEMAIEHAKAQCVLAHDGGLDEEIGDSDTGFDAQWHYDNALDEVMLDLAIRTIAGEILSPRLVLETLVRNVASTFAYGQDPLRVMKNEASCVKKFSNLCKNNGYKLIHPLGWITELVPKSKSARTVNGKPVAYIKVYHPERTVEVPKPSGNVVPFDNPKTEQDNSNANEGRAKA